MRCRLHGDALGFPKGLEIEKKLPNGSISACAGNSPDAAAGRAAAAVHPRVCGELPMVESDAYAALGSSPRVRGTRRPRPGRSHFHRFIPACAGNSTPTRCSADVRTVHPRVCGELGIGDPFRQNLHGSSPRVRGTRRAPAREPWCRTVHPRVCGELPDKPPVRPAQCRFIPACAGNSPAQTDCTQPHRFIPACAGNSSTLSQEPPDHAGSSPRVRGTPALRVALAQRWRFIPACAGNSSFRTVPASLSPVHPRVCGELARRTARS